MSTHLEWWPYPDSSGKTATYEVSENGIIISKTQTTTMLKFMPPGHFCPDVCGIEDFGDADTWRGRVVRGFFRLMKRWPKPAGR